MFLGVMVLSLCPCPQEQFYSSCLVGHVHGDSSGAGGSSCCGLLRLSRKWLLGDLRLTSHHAQNGSRFSSLAQGGLPVPVFSPGGILIPH